MVVDLTHCTALNTGLSHSIKLSSASRPKAEKNIHQEQWHMFGQERKAFVTAKFSDRRLSFLMALRRLAISRHMVISSASGGSCIIGALRYLRNDAALKQRGVAAAGKQRANDAVETTVVIFPLHEYPLKNRLPLL